MKKELLERIARVRDVLPCNIIDIANMPSDCVEDLLNITREFVRMADAGELVRVKTCYECLDDGCLSCDGSGRIYESLTAKGDA